MHTHRSVCPQIRLMPNYHGEVQVLKSELQKNQPSLVRQTHFRQVSSLMSKYKNTVLQTH